MKLSALLVAVVAAEDDRWSFYDYSIPADGKVGHASSGLGTADMGGHEGNRRYCHSTLDTKKIYRWDMSMHGYFGHFNAVECLGEELFCTIEERAHFGQITGIRAGCAQMMNHPQVSTAEPITVVGQEELKNHYNQEAARGQTFNQGGTGIDIFYGVGGCLALPAQNGYDTHHADFRGNLVNNYFSGTNGGYGQNQCLRFQMGDAKAQLLPFGVSVCRACCLATAAFYDINNAVSVHGPCNFFPIGTGGVPALLAADFGCTLSAGTACTSVGTGTDCDVCTKEMFPNFSMYMQPTYGGTTTYSNLFQNGQTPNGQFCTASLCVPESVWSGSQPIAGG